MVHWMAVVLEGRKGGWWQDDERSGRSIRERDPFEEAEFPEVGRQERPTRSGDVASDNAPMDDRWSVVRQVRMKSQAISNSFTASRLTPAPDQSLEFLPRTPIIKIAINFIPRQLKQNMLSNLPLLRVAGSSNVVFENPSSRCQTRSIMKY